MPSRNPARILVLHSVSLLASGLEMILKDEGFSVIGIDTSDQSMGKAALPFQRGDIVLFDIADAGVHPSLSLLQIMMQNPAVVMIGLDPTENRIEIYRKSEKKMLVTADLVKFLKSR